MKDDFQKGDNVWCSMFGWGNVTEVDTKWPCYPVAVVFDHSEDGEEWFTSDGKFTDDSNALRVLFFEEVLVPESALKRPWEPKPGEWVAVRHDDSSTWALRTFIKQQNGKYVCDFPTMQSTFAWEQCMPLSKFIEENKNADKKV